MYLEVCEMLLKYVLIKVDFENSGLNVVSSIIAQNVYSLTGSRASLKSRSCHNGPKPPRLNRVVLFNPNITYLGVSYCSFKVFAFSELL
jgi:hypothetical protein